MAGSSNFVQFNPGAANQLPDSSYDTNPIVTGGITTASIAPSNVFNKLYYQLSTFVAALAGALALKGLVLSDANFSTLEAALGAVQVSGDTPPAIQSVAFSPTPAFNTALGTAFDIVLTGNVTSSTLTGYAPGQILTFIIVQNSAGGWTFAWPSNVDSPPVISHMANAVSIIRFIVTISGSIRPCGPMMIS